MLDNSNDKPQTVEVSVYGDISIDRARKIIEGVFRLGGAPAVLYVVNASRKLYAAYDLAANEHYYIKVLRWKTGGVDMEWSLDAKALDGSYKLRNKKTLWEYFERLGGPTHTVEMVVQ